MKRNKLSTQHPSKNGDGSPIIAPWSVRGDRIRLHVIVKPKSSADVIKAALAIEGRDGEAMAVLPLRVRAQARDGEANQAVIKLLAKALKIPKSQMSFVAGFKSKYKIFEIRGEIEKNIEILTTLAFPHRMGLD